MISINTIDINTNYIELYFGTKINYSQFDTTIDKELYTKNLEFLKKNYKYTKYSKNKYFYKNLIHSINSIQSNTITKNTFKLLNISTKITNQNTIDIFIGQNKKILINDTLFPCSNNYPIIESSKITEFNVTNNLKILFYDSNIKFEITKSINSNKNSNKTLNQDFIDNEWNQTLTKVNHIIKILFN
jgi:hypothetical protein